MKIYHVDAFTSELFGGNPAAVCELKRWLSESSLQKIAAENNLSETAFFIKKKDVFELRWFTPKVEVNLCGHATLAASFVIYTIQKSKLKELRFQTLSGILTVKKSGKGFTMNFPADELLQSEITNEITETIGIKPVEVYYGRNILLIVLSSEKKLLSINPDPEKIKRLHKHGVIVTAKGIKTDFVSRCFFPNIGINEDPVTGSAHTILTPYWSGKLRKNSLTAKQLSERTGDLKCKLINDRVEISGEAVLYMTGEINL